MAYRINVGCGNAPTIGDNWKNFDNSFSITLAKYPEFIFKLFMKMKLLSKAHLDTIAKYRAFGNKIQRADCTALPLKDNSVEVLYTSHMFEHLSREKAKSFLKEAYRVLQPGGIIRLAVPDFDIRFEEYLKTKDVDAFLESFNVTRQDFDKLSQKLRFLVVGDRSHKWMYNGESLSKLLEQCGFVNAQAFSAGQSGIPDPAEIDLNEKSDDSAYVEAMKPGD